VGVYAELGERLIERGYGALPIMPGTKRPGFLFAGRWIGLANWSKRFNGGVPPTTEIARWSAGDAGLGVLGGYHGLVAVDFDTDDPGITAALRRIIPPSPVRKRGQKGETGFYYGPSIKSQSWDINGKRVVDLIGPGRQTVLPPTIHPDTAQPYRWLTAETLDDLAPEELPELPGDIAERITSLLERFGYQQDPAPCASGSEGDAGDNPYRALNQKALANLDSWVPALDLYRCRKARGGYEAIPVWRPSTTGRSPEKRKLNLKIAPAGIRDFGADQGYTALDLVMAACDCDLDTAFKFLAERLAFDIDVDVSGLVPTESEPPEPELVPKPEPAPREPPEAEAEPSKAEPAPAPHAEPDELEPYTWVPGMVGETVDWITATARRPNRVLALAGAISIIGALIGRRVAGPTMSGTNLYVVGVGPSGTGKQHVIDTAMRLMRAANAEAHIGPSRFHSGSAVFRSLGEMPVMLCIQDEIGAVLRAVTDRKAGSHERQIGEVLRALWGSSFSTIAAPAWATQDTIKLVNCPAVSILGLSTPNEFTASLQGESVDNGLLNRFLALSSTCRASDASPVLDPLTVPESLAGNLNRLYLWSGPESLLQIGDPKAMHTPDILPWANPAAEACYMDFTKMVEAHIDEHSDTAPYLARCIETSIRLATIRAAGRWGRGASVDYSDMEWGAGIAWIATQAFATKAQDHLASNERSEMTAKIAGYVRRRQPLTLREIQQTLRGRLRSQEIKDILAQLVEAGEIERTNQGYRPAGR
jgi:hypothetical protein